MLQEQEPPSRDWLSALIVWGLALSPVVIGFTATAIDGGHYVRDSGYNRVWISSGETAQLLRIATIAAMTPLVMLLGSRALFDRGTRWGLLGLCGVIVLLAEVTRLGQSSPLTLVSIFLGCALLMFSGSLQISPFVVRGLAVALAIVSLSLWAHFAIDPVASASPCRADKCSPIGGLMHGFFSQENTLGLYVASLIPTAAAVRARTLRWLVVALALSIIIATGGRTPMLSAMAGLLGMYIAAPFRGEAPRTFTRMIRPVAWLPLLAFLASTALFVALPPAALTGRGEIYALVKKGLAEAPLLGPGSAKLLDAYSNGQAGWVIAHEHGEAPHILNTGGIVLFVVFVIALFQVAARSWRAPGILPIAFAVMPAVGFLSEPTWMFDVRGSNFWTLVVTSTLVAASAGGAQDGRGSPPPEDLVVPATPGVRI